MGIKSPFKSLSSVTVPNSVAVRLILIILGFVMSLGFSYSIYTWFAYDLLPFLTVGSSAQAIVEGKFSRDTSLTSRHRKLSYHVKYRFQVLPGSGPEYVRTTGIRVELYDRVETGTPVDVRYVENYPRYSHPTDDPPQVSEWVLFLVTVGLGLVVIPLGFALIYFGFKRQKPQLSPWA